MRWRILLFVMVFGVIVETIYIYIVGGYGSTPVLTNHITHDLKSRSSGRPMNVLMFGDASNFTYRLTRFLLRHKHRVTLVEPVEFRQNVNYDKYKHFVRFQDDLRTSSYNDTISFLAESTFAVGQPSDNPFSHIIIRAKESFGNSPVFLSEITNCLTSMMEELKTLPSSPRLTFISDGIDVEQCNYAPERCTKYQPVAHNTVQGILHLYNELFNMTATRLVISNFVSYHIEYSTMMSVLMSPVLTQSLCVTVHLNTASNVWRFWDTIMSVFSKEESAHIPDHEHQTTGDVVFSTYFTSKEDPMRGNHKQTNNYSYISAWVESLGRLGLRSVVFHDGLGTNFTDSLKPNVYFEEVALGKRSLNDDRYFHYLRYIEARPKITHVMMTDISDVTFLRDPFEFMRMFDHHLFVCEGKLLPRIGANKWLREKISECFLNDTRLNGSIEWLKQLKPSFNAGVIGGPRHVVLRFLRILTALLDTLPVEANCNMAAVNYVVHKHFHDVVFTGFPFNSVFDKRQVNPPGVYVTHK